MDRAKIDRISELTRISRIRTLTDSENAERAALREEYVAAVRRNLTAQLDNTYVVDERGKKRPLRVKDAGVME